MTFGRIAAALVVATLAVSEAAWANERHFTYTYESAVLPKGEREIEVWMTPRLGKEDYFARFDQRLEFEVGLTDRLMLALYLNTEAKTAQVGDAYETEFEFGGFSTELKYKLLDPVADPVGLALYGEFTGSTNEMEVEGKIILDKRVGNFLFAANLVGEYEWEFEGPNELEREVVAEVDLAGSYFLSDRFSLGLELRNHNEFTDEGWEHSALFAGPVLAYGGDTWWVAVTGLAQLPALKKAEDSTSNLILDEHEKFNGRILFAFHF